MDQNQNISLQVGFLAIYSLLSILYNKVFIHDELLRQIFELVCIYSSR